jgi:hypothetical protein
MLHYLLYVDPGTGSLIYQGLLSALVTISVFSGRIKVFFKQKFNKGKDV